MGRPTDYRPEYDEMAYGLCLIGYTDKQLAAHFAVSEVTLNAWKKKHITFLKSLTCGKVEADVDVVKGLRKRAIGYKYIEVTKETDDKGKLIRKKETSKEVPPDTSAAKHWLGNRQRGLWTDEQKIVVTNKNEPDLSKLSEDELRSLIEILSKSKPTSSDGEEPTGEE